MGHWKVDSRVASLVALTAVTMVGTMVVLTVDVSVVVKAVMMVESMVAL